MVRSSCSSCGSGRIEWTDLDAAARAGVDVAQLRDVEEVWHCLACDEWGFFGGTEFLL